MMGGRTVTIYRLGIVHPRCIPAMRLNQLGFRIVAQSKARDENRALILKDLGQMTVVDPLALQIVSRYLQARSLINVEPGNHEPADHGTEEANGCHAMALQPVQLVRIDSFTAKG
jgi:hypothetical protein